ncbi:MAG: ABC transporter permease [Bryobacteraceae bacterium]
MRFFEATLQDIRYAVRTLGTSRGFALGAICTLALGIGANTAIFSVVSGVLLRPLPFDQPQRLVQLNQTSPGGEAGAVPIPDLEEWRTQSASLEATVGYAATSRNLQNVDEPELVATVAAQRGLFRALGVEAIEGRTFREDDPLKVAVIGAGFRKRHFGSGRPAIGQSITLDGESFTVIGVMPDRFQFPYRASRTELWVPWEIPAEVLQQRLNRRINHVLARLRPGVSIAAAQIELGVIAKRLEAQYPETNKGRGVRITPLADVVAGSARKSLLVLLGAVGLVLLVACANVANLLLARTAMRRKEVAVRVALGAGRLRLVRLLLTESLLLAMGGGILGLAIGLGGSSLLVNLAAAEIPRSWEIGFDWRVFSFLLAVCVVTGVGFGVAPAIAAARVDVQSSLKSSERGGAASGRFRGGLVVAEVALAFVLLTGAGLLLRAFLHLQNTDPGLAAENVLTLHLTISGAQNRVPGAAARYCHDIEARARQIPGVRAAGIISLLPLQHSNWTAHFAIAGRPQLPPPQQPLTELRYVTPGYFQALGIPIRQGRGFTEADNRDAPQVILINEAMARQHFPNQDPIGQRILYRGTIVGVVGDVRQSGLQKPASPEIIYPVAQNFAQLHEVGMTLVVSGRLPPESLAISVRKAIRDLNPGQPVFNVKTMQRVIADSLSNAKLYVSLIGLFAGLALLLSAAGIYGVISYSVTARTQEFGIRMALGAGTGPVLRLVMRQGSVLVALGLAAGVCGALALTRLLAAQLYGVTPADPPTFAAMGTLLALVALAACWIPARRATEVDPAIVLRDE